jgi:geranylgeranyl transferase type-1 subunit beta
MEDDQTRGKHSQFFRSCLNHGLSSKFAALDSNRLTLAFFSVSGLDLLGELESDDCDRIVKWVKAQMICSPGRGGFRGSPFYISTEPAGSPSAIWDVGHITMAYTGLAILSICGAGFADIDRTSILTLVQSLQDDTGAVRCHVKEEATDLRFVFRNN